MTILMMSKKIKRKQGLLLFACFLFFLISLFSSFYQLHEIDHDCCGDDCPVCAFIHAAEQNLLQNTGAVPCLALFFSVVAVLTAVSLWANPVAVPTLVSQKIRLDN